jgi:hypothetical protein
MNGFLLFLFLFGYSKERFLFRATCTTTNEHAEETPRHGAFFHLEIPSVIISGASRVREGGWEEQKKGDGKVARLSVLHDFYLLNVFLSFHFYVFGFNVLRQ